MEVFLNRQLWWVLAAEQRLSFLRPLSVLGDEYFFLLLLPLIYWCVSRQVGRRLGFLLIGGDALNAILKVGFALPRPYWLAPRLKVVGEGSFGLPSSHAMNAASIWTFLALNTKRRALALTLALLLAVGIALSRVSLGVHFPMDVIFGALLGLVVVTLFARGIPKWERRAQSWPLKTQVGVATLASILILIAFFLARHIGQGAPFGIYSPHNPTEDPLSSAAIFKRAGALWGLLVGLCVAARSVQFEVPRSLGHKIGCFFVGIVVMLAIYFGLSFVTGKLFPDSESKIPLLLGSVRYALVSLWVVLGAPWLFVRLKLAPNSLPAVTNEVY